MRSHKSNSIVSFFIAIVAVATLTSSASTCLAFSPCTTSSCSKVNYWGHRAAVSKRASSPFSAATLLLSTPSEDNEANESDAETKAVTTADLYPPSSSSATPPPVEENTGTSYPVDLPSPILLASSMVLAITSTGSLFELTGGQPQLGFAPTLAITVVGFPLCLFLFYAAILKATAETEEDDKRFTRGQ